MQPEDVQLLLTRTMPLGKHKGQAVADLPSNYLNWFAREGFPKGEIGRYSPSQIPPARPT